MDPNRYGPWALIAGGSEGIGLAFARELAQAGIKLVLLARREQPLEAARQALSADFPVEVRVHALDLTVADLDAKLAALTAGLEIGLMVYNAGAVHGEQAQRRDLRVQQRLQCHPLGAGHLVPVADLLGVGSAGLDHRVSPPRRSGSKLQAPRRVSASRRRLSCWE